MAQIRNQTDTVRAALVAAWNLLCRDSVVVGSRFHYDQVQKVSGDFSAPTFASSVTVTAAAATDLATTIALANQLKAFANVHMADGVPTGGTVHKNADTTNGPIATADATDLATAQTLLNAIKTKYNAHLTQANVHANNDGANAVATANATDLATSEALAIALKAAFNLHIASAVGAPQLVLVGA